MVPTNRSTVEPVLSTARQTATLARNSIIRLIKPIWRLLSPAVQFVTSSLFRFLIAFGFVVIGLGAIRGEGVLAGHFLIYGTTAVFIGVLGRGVVHWKLKNST